MPASGSWRGDRTQKRTIFQENVLAKSSIDRAFEILDLLDEHRPALSPEDVAEELNFTRSTTYRYLHTLCNAGLLMQVSRGRYCLGPRIVELERKIQASDPLLTCGKTVMPAFVNQVPGSVLILCGLWGDRVLCLHQENSTIGKTPDFALQRARGLPFPLTKGAASLAILASLTIQRLKSLYLRHNQEILEADLGRTWVEFRRKMRSIRKAGVVMTSGTFGSRLTAISAPIINEDGDVIGSLTRILKNNKTQSEADLVRGMHEAVGEFTRHLRKNAESFENQLTKADPAISQDDVLVKIIA